MSFYHEQTGAGAPEWPYPVRYGKENVVSADVLIVGGGIAGCHAAINAARRGARVVVVEKGATVRSGSGGAGVDHWGDAMTNPCSRLTPDQVAEAPRRAASRSSYTTGIVRYITMKESWDALLDVEKMGVQFRDVDDEFAGAPFRDDETKIMFAYDYENRTNIRVRGGAKVKPALYKELKRLGVAIYDRVAATSLLTEGGKPGARVIGATGVNVRTGEFDIFKAKATVLTAAHFSGIWVFSTELAGSSADRDDPNSSGDGSAMAWKAGAMFTLMERSRGPVQGGFSWPRFGVGNPNNTWYPCTVVDARGKEVPWVDRKGRVLKDVAERLRNWPAELIPDLPERIRSGEFVLPLYADLPGMPEHERRAIFGLMVGNEGKTRVPVYQVYTQAGFDPDKDMLQAPITSVEAGGEGLGPPQWRDGAAGGGWTGGGVVVDWDLKTNLEGLYAAGNQVAACVGGHPGAAATGRYAGRKAAAYARIAGEPVTVRRQIEDEKARIYAPVGRKGDIGWKELHAGICRVMQVYCGEYKSEEMLKTGLWWLNSIKESEASRTYIRNPHELGRYLECLTRITISEMIIHASLSRKASSVPLGFNRVDYPELDPLEWNKFITTRLENGEVKVGELPSNYWLLPPNAPTYRENYEVHCECDG
ncbi:MAG: FAD-binding protein [Chloroflexi bacterium]|nr:FAD-binding protein [Chloroflexota bacterium]